MTRCPPVSHFLMAILASAAVFTSCISRIHGRPVENTISSDSNIYTTSDIRDTMSGPDDDDCTKNFAVLEKALVETADNKFKLIQAFYPIEKYDTIYVKDVEYHFLGKDENDSEVISRSWIWTDSAFYLIQPPSIFQYTSLLFTSAVGEVDNTPLSLYLPYQCRNGNLNISKFNNTCHLGSNSINPMLGILTERLNYYAKFNDPGHIVVESESITVAVCDSDLESDVYDNKRHITTFLILVVSLPLSFLILLVMVVKSLLNPIRRLIRKPSNHANIAAFALTGIYCSIFILIMDSVALHLILQNHHELSNHKHYYPIYFVIGLFVIDVISLFAVFYVYLYLFITCCIEDENKCTLAWLSCIFACMYFPIFGPIDPETDNNDSPENKTAQEQPDQRLSVNAGVKETNGTTNSEMLSEYKIWLVLSGFIAPFVCLLSHSGFIIVAWVSNPQHAWSSALRTLFSFLFFFFMLRQAYMQFNQSWQERGKSNPQKEELQPQTHGRTNPGESDGGTFKSLCKYCCYYLFCSWLKACFCNTNCRKLENGSWKKEDCCSDYELLTLKEPDKKDEIKYKNLSFNFGAFFCAALFIGVFIVAIEALITFSFIELPFSTDTAPSYILNIAQLAFLVIASFVAYKVVVLQKPAEKSILEEVKEIQKHLRQLTQAHKDGQHPPTLPDKQPTPPPADAQVVTQAEIHTQ